MSHFAKETHTEKVNFLASEVGLRMVTAQVDSDGIEADAQGKKIVPAGTIVDGKGVIFEDVDVTDGAHEAALIVAGHLLSDKMPVAPSEGQVTAFAAKGLFFEESTAAERPTA